MPKPTILRDFRDALQDARDMAKDADRAFNDNADYERQLRLKYIEASFNFLIEARMLLMGASHAN